MEDSEDLILVPEPPQNQTYSWKCPSSGCPTAVTGNSWYINEMAALHFATHEE